jgi:hypothetical protein
MRWGFSRAEIILPAVGAISNGPTQAIGRNWGIRGKKMVGAIGFESTT